MQKHKESHKENSELKCLMCGSILPSWQQAGSPIDDRPSTIFLGIVSVGIYEHLGSEGDLKKLSESQ